MRETPLYQQACQLIDDSGLERIAPYLKQHLRYAISIESSLAQGYTFPLGASRLGGTPDLPEGLAWPIWKGVPMVFLAQINLSETTAYDLERLLPTQGWLYFFCQSQEFLLGFDHNGWGYIDPREPDSWKVLLFEGALADLHPAPAPETLTLSDNMLLPCTLQLIQAVTLPDENSLLIESLHLDIEEGEVYRDLVHACKDLSVTPDDKGYHHHQLLGHPRQLANAEVELECHLASEDIWGWNQFDEATKAALKTDALRWTHLLQIDTDDYAKISWGEVGSLSYWVKRADLKKHKFEGCWAISDSL